MRVLVACEKSQTVCLEFRKLGHEAYSNDVQDCSGGRPEYHLRGSVFDFIDMGWDLLIAHPPCTYMSKAGARWMYRTAGVLDMDRYSKAMEAKIFFERLLNSDIPKIAIENPVPLNVVGLPKPTQVIQPYEFGHSYSKKTLLWLKNLDPLQPTEIIKEFVPYLPSNTGGKKRGQKATPKTLSQEDSSKTFQGIAKAMAEQWGSNIKPITVNSHIRQLQLF